MSRTDPSDLPVSDETIQSLLVAMRDQTRSSWYRAGVDCANNIIDVRPDIVTSELVDADHEWNHGVPIGRAFHSLLAGYRDTLREYTERGTT